MNFDVKIEGDKKLERELREKVKKMSRIANKRLGRLRVRGYTDTPAYRAWENDRGGVNFGVRGKDYNELQAEYWRVKKFLDARTSTIRGANSYIKDIGKSLGLKGTIKELRQWSKIVFELASKIKQYDMVLGNAALALDYQKIFEQISTMIRDDNLSFDRNSQVERQVDDIERALQAYIDIFRN